MLEVMRRVGWRAIRVCPQGGEITGILKEMGDEMSKDLTTATNEETTAIKGYEELAAAKKKEIDALTASVVPA